MLNQKDRHLPTRTGAMQLFLLSSCSYAVIKKVGGEQGYLDVLVFGAAAQNMFLSVERISWKSSCEKTFPT